VVAHHPYELAPGAGELQAWMDATATLNPKG